MTENSKYVRFDWAIKHVKSQEEWNKMTEQEQREYRDYMVSVHAAKDAWDTAIDEAKAEGRDEKNRENARRMIELGIQDDVIAKVTGLTPEEIESM